ncbi:MAG: thiamine phosphate synthase [Gammaproteobacteria bacterium]
MSANYLKLCLVTDIKQQTIHEYKNFISQCIQGGITSVQLRAKQFKATELRQWALALKSILQPQNIPLIINDNVAIAKEIDADGVHLGQSDISPQDARQLLGENKIIGWSVETMLQLELANQLTCIDYIAASAIYPSKTKLDCKTIWQIDGLKEIVKKSKHPAVAIGGINLTNVQEVIEAGAAGVAIVSAIHDAADPVQLSADLIKRINHVYQNY